MARVWAIRGYEPAWRCCRLFFVSGVSTWISGMGYGFGFRIHPSMILGMRA